MAGRSAVLLALAAAGCAAVVGVRHGGGSAPTLSTAERAYLVDGDADAAEASLGEEISRDPDAAEAHLLLADLLDATGRPAEAFAHDLRVLELGRADGRFSDASIAAAIALVAIRDRVPDLFARFAVWADTALARPGALPAEAVYELRNLRFAVALHRGEVAAGRGQLLAATGCLARWEVLGPYGPRAYESLDALDEIAPWLAGGGAWPAGAALGPGRGAVEARRVEVTRCAVPAFHPEARAPGLGLARTVVALEREGTVLFRLETDASARVYAGGVEIFSRERRKGWPPRYAWFAARLPEGNTEISVAIAHPDAAPVFALAAVRADDGAAIAAHGPEILPSKRVGGREVRPPVSAVSPRGASRLRRDSATASLARFRAAVWRKNDAAARLELASLERAGATSSPAVIAAAAQAALADPDQPIDVAFETARGLMSSAVDAEPRLWEARLLLARAEEGDGRLDDAIDLVREGRALTPAEPALADRLVELLFEAGYAAEAEDAAAALAAMMPGSCAALGHELAVGRGAPGSEDRVKLAARLAACDRSSDALAEALMEAQRWAEARAEYARLLGRDPRDPALARAEAKAALFAGDAEGAIDAARAASSEVPTDPDLLLSLADALAARGEGAAAADILERGAVVVASGRERLVAAAAAIRGDEPYAPFRVDGLAAVAGYLADAPSYDTEAVWVLDRAVQIVGSDGSRTELTHNIVQLLSPQAIAEHGEIEPPDDAALLTARAIKADGTVRTRERIDGKPGLSLPDLQPGDFVEVEYARHVSPSPLFPGGFDTGRFYFQDFEHAFHRSEMVVVAPIGMVLDVDTRGASPPASESEHGGLRVVQWRARRVGPLVEEPLSPEPAERLPSIRVTSGASLAAICGRVRELLADKDAASPEIAALARDLVRGAPGERDRLAAIYRWVTERVVDDGDLGGVASHIIARRVGSRARAFLALARAVGINGRLAFVRAASSDETAIGAADPSVVERVAVAAGGRFLSFEEDAAPFGYLPPDLRHRPALFPDTCEIAATDGGTVPRDKRLVAMALRIGEAGDAEAEVAERLVGADAAAWRDELRGLTQVERERAFAERYVSRIWPGATLTRLEISRLDEDEEPLVLTYSLSSAELVRESGGALRASLPFARTLVRDVGGRATRTAPAVLSAYEEEEVSIDVIPPKGCEISADVGDGSSESRWGRAVRSVSRSGDGLGVIRGFRLEAGRIAPEEYAVFVEFAEAADALSTAEFSMRCAAAPRP
jgi:tetratricopeptide (TPR) repeat protein